MKKLLALLMATSMMLAAFAGCAQTPSDTGESDATAADTSAPVEAVTDEIAWDQTTDFLIVGYGLAGAAAAAEASDIDPNANILVLEKMPPELAGGNSIASGQTFIIPAEDDIETFRTYMEACFEPNPIPDEYLDWLITEFATQPEWISSTIKEAGFEIGYVGGGPTRWGSLVVEFDTLPGSDFKGASAHIREIGGSFMPGGVWHGFNEAVKLRENVEIAYSTRAIELIQDPETKKVEGVLAVDSTGKEIRIKGEKGVLIATGGFENDLQMQRDLHGGDTTYTSGTPGNTGDGLRMMMEVGAEIWHVNNQTQSGGFWQGLKVPDFESTFILNMTWKSGDYLQVDSGGNRYYNESGTYHRQHMKALEFGKYLDLPLDLAQPVHFIFDEDFRTSNLLVSPWLGWPITTEGYVWSADNQVEIDKGWIMKADTIEELAEMIGKDPATIKATVDSYNQAATSGNDSAFNRDAATMSPIDNGPYYAVEVVPTLVATTGGAVRNTDGQVLDWDGEVIPNLYEAGELGSYVSNLYQNGVFLSEAIASGRTAAQHAFGGESTRTDAEFEILDEVIKEEGTVSIFEDELDGLHSIVCENLQGTFTIDVKISQKKVALIEFTDGIENIYISEEAMRPLFNDVIANQSVNVDVIAGATIDSNAILDGILAEFS